MLRESGFHNTSLGLPILSREQTERGKCYERGLRFAKVVVVVVSGRVVLRCTNCTRMVLRQSALPAELSFSYESDSPWGGL